MNRLIRLATSGACRLFRALADDDLRDRTAAQRDKLIKDAPSDDLRFILFAGFHCGMRKNEIIEARVDWFDLGESGAVHASSEMAILLN